MTAAELQARADLVREEIEEWWLTTRSMRSRLATTGVSVEGARPHIIVPPELFEPLVLPQHRQAATGHGLPRRGLIIVEGGVVSVVERVTS